MVYLLPGGNDLIEGKMDDAEGRGGIKRQSP